MWCQILVIACLLVGLSANPLAAQTEAQHHRAVASGPRIVEWPRYELRLEPARRALAAPVSAGLTDEQMNTLSKVGLVLMGLMALWLISR